MSSESQLNTALVIAAQSQISARVQFFSFKAEAYMELEIINRCKTRFYYRDKMTFSDQDMSVFL